MSAKPYCMVLRFQPELTHSVWVDFYSRHKSRESLDRFLKREIRKGTYVGYRFYWPAGDDVIIDWTVRPFEERAEAILSFVFRGIHHCHKIKKEPKRWETNKYGDLSTFDFDELTRLVFAAHHYCCRASVKASGPGMVKIVIHERIRRDGDTYDRHPTLQEAIQTLGGKLP